MAESVSHLPRPPRAFPPLQYRTIHGYRRAYRIAGDPDAPAVLLLHGIGDSSEVWREVLPDLAQDYRVLAPDMLGHGGSAKPRADYSVGGFANGMRDLLSVLGIQRVTTVGHSLGAGVAMQFAYQYPDRCERLVLVSAGGVSRSVAPILRLATLPFSSSVIGLVKVPLIHRQATAFLRGLAWLGTSLGVDADDLTRVLDALPDATARRAFTRTLRASVDWRGQFVTMVDRCYLAAGMPTLLVWGGRDAVIPVHHARLAHAAMPGSRLEVFDGAGHFPFQADPERFVQLIRSFVADTAPADWSIERWRELMREGGQTMPSDGDQVSAANTRA